jgi:hypothetical protein
MTPMNFSGRDVGWGKAFKLVAKCAETPSLLLDL